MAVWKHLAARVVALPPALCEQAQRSPGHAWERKFDQIHGELILSRSAIWAKYAANGGVLRFESNLQIVVFCCLSQTCKWQCFAVWVEHANTNSGVLQCWVRHGTPYEQVWSNWNLLPDSWDCSYLALFSSQNLLCDAWNHGLQFCSL